MISIPLIKYITCKRFLLLLANHPSSKQIFGIHYIHSSDLLFCLTRNHHHVVSQVGLKAKLETNRTNNTTQLFFWFFSNHHCSHARHLHRSSKRGWCWRISSLHQAIGGANEIYVDVIYVYSVIYLSWEVYSVSGGHFVCTC